MQDMAKVDQGVLAQALHVCSSLPRSVHLHHGGPPHGGLQKRCSTRSSAQKCSFVSGFPSCASTDARRLRAVWASESPTLSLSLFLSPGLWCRGFAPSTARLCAPDSCGGQKVARSHGKREPKMEEASLCNCTPEYRQTYQEGSRRSTRNY